jgi:sugar phosphate isomerase/epimerase
MSFATSPAPTVFGPLLFAGDVGEAVRVAAMLGYEGIEISMRSAGEVDAGWLAERLAAAQLRLSALGTGRVFLEDGLSFSSPDAEVRRAAVARVRAIGEFAAPFGALVIVGLVRGARPAGGDGAREQGCIVDCLRECADSAGEAGVSIVVEAINRYETAFQNTAAGTRELLDVVGRPNLGLLLDCFHMNIEEPSLAAAIVAAGDRLGYVHVVDSNRWAPGLGHLDYGPVVDALVRIGYQGWLSAEILPKPDDLAAARQARVFVRGASARV